MNRLSLRSLRARSLALGLFTALSLLALSPVAHAEEMVWATGKVVDAGGRPMKGALVAVYDDSNKVVDYARTDSNGEYALAVPRRVLHLDPKHGKGFIAEVFGTALRFAGDAAGFVSNPVRAGVRAVTSSQAANAVDPITKGEITAGGVVADRALAMVTPRSHRPPPPSEERKLPGVMMMKVVAPNNNDLLDIGRVYWMQNEIFRAGGKQQKTTAAWLDPIQLNSADSDRPSRVQSEYLRFSSARLEPSIAEAGQRVRITARLPLPPEPVISAIVVARNNRTGQMWELQSVGEGRYEGEFQVDRKFPRDDQQISLIAYAALEAHPGRRNDAEHAIEGAGLWDLRKSYRYDPLLVVSRNRADLTLTVVVPAKRR